MRRILNHILVLAFFLNALLVPSIAEAQDDKPLKADLNENMDPQDLKKALQDLRETVDEETRNFPADHYVELAEWVLEKFAKWQKLHPPEEAQIEIPPLLPLDGKTPDNVDPFAEDRPDSQVGFTSLDQYDFLFTLNSIFEKLFFAEPDGSISKFITLAKKHPTLRSEPIFISLLNNYLIIANIQKLTKQQRLSKSLPEAAEKLPDFLREAEAPLQSAWRKAKFIEKTVIDLPPEDDADAIHYLSDNEFFDKIIGECLIDDNWAKADTIKDYTWGHWCGVGSEEFTWQKLNFLILHRAHLGKSDEGLALFIYSWLSRLSTQNSIMYDFDNERWDNMLSTNIQKLGIDWQSPACGMLLMHSRWINSRRLATKARQKTAQLLSLTGKLQLPDATEILEVLVGILRRHSTGDLRYRSDPSVESHGGKFPLNPEIKSQAIQTIASLIHQVEYGSELIEAIELLATLAPKTSKEGLLQLVSSPVPSVSQAAYDALKENGYQDELKALSASKQESYQFTFLLGGKPLSNLPIDTDQILITPNHKSFTIFGWLEDGKLDAKGNLQFKRYNNSHASDTRGGFAIHPRGKKHLIPWTPGTPIFAFMESFADLKKRQNQIIDIPLNPLTIKLQIPKNRLARPEDEQATQIVIRTQPLLLADSEMSAYFHAANYKLETQQDYIKIDQTGPARYSFHVQTPGCAIYSQAEPINVTQKQEILIKLKPGHQLKYSLDRKKNENFSVSLMRENIDKKGVEKWEYISEVEYNWQFINWNHLEPGKYKLNVFNQRKPSLDPTEIKFEIKPSDPEIVDLGNIKVPH